MPHGGAHGYITAQLKPTSIPADEPAAKALLNDIRKDSLDPENAKYPTKPGGGPAPKLTISLMEDTETHKQGKRKSGTELFVFVEFNPTPPGYQVAHEHIHDLEAEINKNSNVAAGLGNHFCCYSDA
jgi:hypothetical protein